MNFMYCCIVSRPMTPKYVRGYSSCDYFMCGVHVLRIETHLNISSHFGDITFETTHNGSRADLHQCAQHESQGQVIPSNDENDLKMRRNLQRLHTTCNRCW